MTGLFFAKRIKSRCFFVINCLIVGSIICTCTACEYDHKKLDKSSTDYGTRKGENKKYAAQAPKYGVQLKGINNHDNKHLKYDQKASNLVGSMNGVALSIVLITDRNAYAAIALDNTANGMMRGVSETDNTGSTRGLYYPKTGSSYIDPNKIVTGTNSYQTKKDDRDLSHILKQKIAEKLRLAYPYLIEVYISANRDVINRMNVYSLIARQGHSLDGYCAEFNEFATRVWGTSRTISDIKK